MKTFVPLLMLCAFLAYLFGVAVEVRLPQPRPRNAPLSAEAPPSDPVGR